MEMLHSTELWMWIERVSWVVGIVGLVVAVVFGLPQLRAVRADLRRSTDEATRRPRFTISFEQPDMNHKTLRLEPPPAKADDLIGVLGDLSTITETVWVAITNDGDRSASNVNITLAIDSRVRPPGDLLASSAASRRALNVVTSPDGDTLIAVREDPYLHPGMTSANGLRLRFPRESLTYELLVIVHCAELPATRATLRLTTAVR